MLPKDFDPARLLHPNAPAAGCGMGNSRLPGPLCGSTAPHGQVHVDAPAHHAAWYDPILGVFPKRVMAVYDAITGAHRYLARALIDATGMELHDVLAGILPSLLIMVAVLALTTTIGTAAGAALGALAFGIGAAPGAVAGAGVGLEVGTALLEWLGLAFLVVYIGKSLLAGTKLAAAAVARAWHSVDQPAAMREVNVGVASHELAMAVALVFRGVLQGIVAFLLAKGTAAVASRVPELAAKLRTSKLGGTFAEWVERNWVALVDNPKLKGTSTPEAAGTAGPKPAPRAQKAAVPEDARPAAEPKAVASSAEKAASISEKVGADYKNNPLRQAYEGEVAGLKGKAEAMAAEGAPKEELAHELWQDRRDIGVKYKNLTPEPLRDYIAEVNTGRYGDPLGPKFADLVDKQLEKGSTLDQAYDKIIQSSATPNKDVNGLLSNFETWLSQNDGAYLDNALKVIGGPK